MNRYDLISIFPQYFEPLKLSLIGKASGAGLVSINAIDLRDFAQGNHKSVDDTPYGGGAGMVMSAEPWGSAIDSRIDSSITNDLIILTPAGKKFDQKLAQELAKSEHLIFACGRYEGVDHRVSEHYKTVKNVKVHEISIGDYVLNGGEVAALVILEAVIRLLPGVIGNPESLNEESHSITQEDQTLLEYPSYTKPAIWRGLPVPEILLSGNHGEIENWRKAQAIKRTKEVNS